MWLQNDGFELDRECIFLEALKKGVAVLSVAHDGVLREATYPQLVRPRSKREREETSLWLG
jgi:hypothetical protein